MIPLHDLDINGHRHTYRWTNKWSYKDYVYFFFRYGIINTYLTIQHVSRSTDQRLWWHSKGSQYLSLWPPCKFSNFQLPSDIWEFMSFFSKNDAHRPWPVKAKTSHTPHLRNRIAGNGGEGERCLGLLWKIANCVKSLSRSGMFYENKKYFCNSRC